MKETITSVGIDIGTSTTQLIFSRLTIENLASSYTVPRISIVDKEVIYRSHIYFTPLKSQQEIDVEAVRKIVKEEYEKAGMTPDMLQTGAVIITGETARKQNANLVLEMLSDNSQETSWWQRRDRIWNPCFPVKGPVQTGFQKKNVFVWQM